MQEKVEKFQNHDVPPTFPQPNKTFHNLPLCIFLQETCPSFEKAKNFPCLFLFPDAIIFNRTFWFFVNSSQNDFNRKVKQKKSTMRRAHEKYTNKKKIHAKKKKNLCPLLNKKHSETRIDLIDKRLFSQNKWNDSKMTCL